MAARGSISRLAARDALASSSAGVVINPADFYKHFSCMDTTSYCNDTQFLLFFFQVGSQNILEAISTK